MMNTSEKLTEAKIAILIQCSIVIFLFHPIFGNKIPNVDDVFGKMNEELLNLNRMNAVFEWESATKPSSNISNIKKEFYKLKAQWKEKWCNKFQRDSKINQLNELNNFSNWNEMSKINEINEIIEDRVSNVLCGGARYSEEQSSLLSLISDDLLSTYQSTQICDDSNKCFHAEPDLKRLMATSKEEKTLKWAWMSWRNAISSVKSIYLQFIGLENAGARTNGYDNIGDIWKEEIGLKNTEEVMNSLWSQIKEFYSLLHSVIRFKLKKVYPEIIDPVGPIPVHLLGDLWGQNWSGLLDLIFPNSSIYFNTTKSLEDKNYTVLDMVKRSEDFYVSLGFPRLPEKFWQNSIFMKKGEENENCHGSAANMYEIGDFRILGCFQVNEGDFRVIHHEMGHIYYYMAYEDQEAIFRNGVNTAFHESIGESILLGATVPQHLHRLGIADDAMLIDDLGNLLKEALIKIPQAAYGLVLEKWRLRFFEGKIPPNELNYYWWKLHEEIMGVVPPDSRSDAFYFDPAAKFHVVANIPYLRYFFAGFLQFQIFESMCQIAVTGKIEKNFDFPLHKCDIYGSQESTKLLRNVMKMGNTLTLSEALQKITKNKDFKVEPLMKYFKPVYDFLLREIKLNSIPVGWF